MFLAGVSHYPLLSQQDTKKGFVTNVVQCMTPITPPEELETTKADENARGKCGSMFELRSLD